MRTRSQNSVIRSRGFSLIEMMLAMLVGSIILAGIFTLFSNTREAQRTLDQQLTMTGDARFAIELLTFDLRHASIYGGTNLATIVECRYEDASCSPATTTGECFDNWVHDIDLPLYTPSDAVNPDLTYMLDNCGDPVDVPFDSHVNGTDIIVVRYADTNPVADADLQPGVHYIRSNYKAGKLFTGNDWGDFSGDTNDSFTKNYQLYNYAYYISDHTDDPDDGIPSLRRLALQVSDSNEPVLVDQVLLSGVENLQIQFGIDTDDDDEINRYVDSSNVSTDSVFDVDDNTRRSAKSDWSKIKAAKIWVLVRAEKQEDDLNTSSADGAGYSLGGFIIPDSDLNDGYRRILTSNVIRMRNMEYDALITPTDTTTPTAPVTP